MEAKEVKSFSKPTGYCFLSHTPEWIHMFLERIISLYLTWRQKKLNPFQNLLAIAS
ncbi:hypothetical protein [Wolbachia endosymbiont of Ctenocephalides felis wCfeT]|uniref:hypothetical protein n=1 Tax=Wolbachia endosymbiont of Ctenocephalides felis wCfeT TaxID=2732593 RepID=UPI001447EC64|nr:hypothetical protein [Wolbachia endosymbiont of Ctenocephalides felis wCfeT]